MFIICNMFTATLRAVALYSISPTNVHNVAVVLLACRARQIHVITLPIFFMLSFHDGVIKWKHFLRYWPLVRGIPGEFPAQRPVTRSFDIFFNLRLNKRVSKQWWGWWPETLSRPLWRHCLCMITQGATPRDMSKIDLYQNRTKHKKQIIFSNIWDIYGMLRFLSVQHISYNMVAVCFALICVSFITFPNQFMLYSCPYSSSPLHQRWIIILVWPRWWKRTPWKTFE